MELPVRYFGRCSKQVLQGVPRDVAETVIQKMKKIEEAWKGGELDDLEEKCHPLWSIISHEVTKQKKRLGGDFAVAQAVISREGGYSTEG